MATPFRRIFKALDMRSNLSGSDHRQMVCNSEFVWSQTRNLGYEDSLGIVACFQKDMR